MSTKNWERLCNEANEAGLSVQCPIRHDVDGIVLGTNRAGSPVEWLEYDAEDDELIMVEGGQRFTMPDAITIAEILSNRR